jgi:hypothetical protein
MTRFIVAPSAAWPIVQPGVGVYYTKPKSNIAGKAYAMNIVTPMHWYTTWLNRLFLGLPPGIKPPYFCSKMPTLVETGGGDYFFVPSMTCLRMIGLGIIDPT